MYSYLQSKPYGRYLQYEYRYRTGPVRIPVLPIRTYCTCTCTCTRTGTVQVLYVLASARYTESHTTVLSTGINTAFETFTASTYVLLLVHITSTGTPYIRVQVHTWYLHTYRYRYVPVPVFYSYTAARYGTVHCMVPVRVVCS